MRILILLLLICGSVFADSNMSINKGLVGHWELDRDSGNNGGDIYDTNKGNFQHSSNIGDYGWTAYANNVISIEDQGGGNNALKIEYVDSGDGAVTVFTAVKDLSEDTVQNEEYLLKLKGKVDAGSADIRISIDGVYYNIGTISSTSFSEITYKFTKTSAALNPFLNTTNSSATYLWLDDISLESLHKNQKDSTPNSNIGIRHKCSYTTDRNGVSNKAMSFDGVDDKVEIDIDLNDVDTFTISAWGMTNDNNGDSLVIYNQDDIAPVILKFELRLSNAGSNYPLFEVVNSSGTVFTASNQGFDDAVIGEWKHLVGVCDDNTKTIKLYINGVLADTTSYTGTLLDLNSTKRLRFGERINYKLNGSMQDVRVYNRALDSTEIKTLYNSYNPKIENKDSGLVGHWKLNKERSGGFAGEMIVDGDMSSATNWNLATGVTIGSGVMSWNVADNKTTYQTNVVDYGQDGAYKLTFDISNYTSGSILFSLGDDDTINYDANGSYTAYLHSASGVKTFFITSNTVTGFVGDIDNISLQQMQLKDFSTNNNQGTVYYVDLNTDIRGNYVMDFNGTTDYIDIGDIAQSINSICFWARMDTNTQSLIDLDGGTSYISTTLNTISANGFTSPTIYAGGVVSSTLPFATWTNVCITTETGIDVNAMTIGNVGSNYYNGRLQDIRLYNKVLTADEVLRISKDYDSSLFQ